MELEWSKFSQRNASECGRRWLAALIDSLNRVLFLCAVVICAPCGVIKLRRVNHVPSSRRQRCRKTRAPPWKLWTSSWRGRVRSSVSRFFGSRRCLHPIRQAMRSYYLLCVQGGRGFWTSRYLPAAREQSKFACKCYFTIGKTRWKLCSLCFTGCQLRIVNMLVIC